jgi:hypothetical protein
MTICWGMGEKMDPLGPDREGENGTEREPDDGTGLTPHSGSSEQKGAEEESVRQASFKRVGLERADFQGAGLKICSQRLNGRGQLALGAEAQQTTVDWKTKLLGLQFT